MSARDDSSLYEQISALLDGALPDAEALELRRRIDAHPDLRREFESLQKAVDAIRGLERTTAPVELRERLQRRSRRPRPLLRLLTGIAAGLAAAAALVIALQVGLESSAPEDRFQEASAPDVAARAAVGDEKRASREQAVTDPAEAEAESEDAEESLRLLESKRIEAGAATADAESAVEEKLERDLRQQPKAPAPAVEKSARPAGELREVKEMRATLVTRAASGGPVTSEPERSRYLLELSELESKDLSSHFAALESRGRRGFAATPSPVGAKKANAKARPPVPVAAEAMVTGRNEALLIQEILRRAFPAPRDTEGGPPEIQLGGSAQELFIQLDLTPGELTQVHAWLDILKDSRRADRGGGSGGRARPRFESAKDRGDISAGVEPTERGQSLPKRPIRVRLVYAPRPAPQPEAERDPADGR